MNVLNKKAYEDLTNFHKLFYSNVVMDLGVVETPLLQCHCSVLPLYDRPSSES